LKLVLAASQMKRLNTAGDPSEAGGWIKPS
jgi:hypothetical protein